MTERLVTVEEILKEQEERERPLVEAVENVLLPSLSEELREEIKPIVEKHGAGVVYGATEAVSLLLTRWVRNYRNFSFLIDKDAVARSMRGDLLTSSMAIEVARFTDLWENNEASDEDLQPSEDVFQLLRWMVRALCENGNILRHFDVEVADKEIGVQLKLVPLKQRVDDMAVRWAKK
ncbi:hypothetical protein KJ885_00370 [Patescibacteria group bacterium]|nr:hypothetical protein [Patescibacteria group bacterium]